LPIGKKNPEANMEEAGLFVKTITVDGGMMLKDYVQRHKVHRIRKRSNHVTIVLDLLITHKQFNKDGTKDKSNWK
jgi:large subunit ribosomal protein L22